MQSSKKLHLACGTNQIHFRNSLCGPLRLKKKSLIAMSQGMLEKQRAKNLARRTPVQQRKHVDSTQEALYYCCY